MVLRPPTRRVQHLDLAFSGCRGVVSEREGKIDEAARWYQAAAELFPTAADPVYNLAVLDWKRGDWPSAAARFAMRSVGESTRVSTIFNPLRRKDEPVSVASTTASARLPAVNKNSQGVGVGKLIREWRG